MGLSDHLRCPDCGEPADDGCGDDCRRLLRLAAKLRRDGFDPDEYEGATLATRIDLATWHRQETAR